MPGLLLPSYNVAGEIAGYQYKPDVPRVVRGKANKYESPPKSLSQLDVPPRARPWVLDPEEPLVFIEGIKKGDSGASHEIACVAITGVWNWRSADVMAALDQIPLKGRTAYLGFDSDYQRNAGVKAAKRRFAAVLRQRAVATVYDILFPEPTPGVKVGADDFFVSGHTKIDLFGLDTVELTDDDPDGTAGVTRDDDANHPYISTPAGIVYRRPTQNGPVDQPLSNFTARIVEEVIADDGASERAELAIAGDLSGEPLRPIRVPTRSFGSLD
jgi:hypothetical protein